nr:integrase, catalytic region, zinc finger, CCHC-type, peptidase aspartic, catalytic [Tanacetum cinerariifolium]
EYGHVAREFQKPKRAKDAAYHREKMLLYAQCVRIESVDMNYDSEQIDQNDEDVDLAKERNLKLLINFVEKFLGTVKFWNDQIAPILGYGDLVQRAVTIKRVYYVEGLNHNLFSVGQFYDADLEVAFRKSTCFIRDLKGNIF